MAQLSSISHHANSPGQFYDKLYKDGGIKVTASASTRLMQSFSKINVPRTQAIQQRSLTTPFSNQSETCTLEFQQNSRILEQ